jgi:V/A-type H+/Na+-transporting ATPase subunit K
MRVWVFGVEGLNLFLVLAVVLLLAQPVYAQETGAAGQNRYLGAAIATGLAAIGAGIAVGIAGAAAIGAIAEKPELLGRTLIFVGLAEGIVIYGLIVSFIILRG